MIPDRVPSQTRGSEAEGAGGQAAGEAVRQEEGQGGGRDEVPREDRGLREEGVRGGARTPGDCKEEPAKVGSLIGWEGAHSTMNCILASHSAALGLNQSFRDYFLMLQSQLLAFIA